MWFVRFDDPWLLAKNAIIKRFNTAFYRTFTTVSFCENDETGKPFGVAAEDRQPLSKMSEPS
jgi:hypothetical protein